MWPLEFHGDPLEVVVIGESSVGSRNKAHYSLSGGCLDGTEILESSSISNRLHTVGQTVFWSAISLSLALPHWFSKIGILRCCL